MKSYVILAGMLSIVIFGIIVITIQEQKTDKTISYDSDIVHANHFQIYETNNGYILLDGAQRKIEIDDKNSIHLPARRLVLFSSTHAAFLDKLNQTGKIVGIAWANSYDWYISSIKNGFADKSITDIGTANNPNYDVIASLRPDLVLLVGGLGMWETHAKKLDELGIDYVVVSEWMEEDTLGKFEWIKFFGILTGSYDLAKKIFDDELYYVKKISQKTIHNEKPSILWAGVFNGIAFVPRVQTYAVNAINEANANYVFSDLNGTGSSQLSLEELLVRGKNADILIYTSAFVNHTSQITSQYQTLAKLKPILQCSVYSFHPRYWQSADEYGMFAADMAAMAHPDVFPEHRLQLFQKAECS